MRQLTTYRMGEVRPYINWAYFMHAWGMSGKPHDQQQELRQEAERTLDAMDSRYVTRAIVGLYTANSDGDDIIVGKTRIPMLRQQRPSEPDGACLCLADFIRPLSQGRTDRIGIFATTVDHAMETWGGNDPYKKMMAQTLADRLAEATAERLHQQVRTTLWAYANNEQLSMEQLHNEQYQGIRPAVGYPSLPDTSINFILARLIRMERIGIRLTESGMMMPHASVSGFMLAHPAARYFDVGTIGEDQLADYARRRGVPTELMRRFIRRL